MLRKTNRHLNRIVLICITLTLVTLFGYSIQHASSPNSTSPGNVWAWGSNQRGQLGDNTENSRPTPGGVEGVEGSLNPYLGGAINLAGGGTHTLALMSDTTIAAVGQNGSGQLGITDVSRPRDLPVLVRDGSNQVFANATAVTAGNGHSMALRSDNTVWAWGLNNGGQLGTDACVECGTPFPPPNPVPSPVRIHPSQGGEFVTGIRAIDAGGFFSLALKTDGTVLSWGSNNNNALGNSAIIGPRSRTSHSPRAVPVDVLTGITALAAGDRFALALKANGTVWAWGNNFEGQLGTGGGSDDPNGQLVPVQINGLSNVIAIAAGGRHSLALKEDGTVWAWGDNAEGQVGDGTNERRLTPVQINLTGVRAVAAGANHSLALKNDGTVLAWGLNNVFQLGLPTSVGQSNIPLEVSGINGVSLIDAGENHNLALKLDNITGQVISNQGVGIEGITINVSGPRSGATRTNRNGFYALGVVERGFTYLVTPVNPPSTFTPPNRTVANLMGNQTADFSTQVPPDGCIRGQIKDLNQQFLSGVTVTLSGGQSPISQQTDAEGKYAFNELRTGLPYTVTPSAELYNFEPPTRSFNPLTGCVTDANFTATLNDFTDPSQQAQDIVWTWGQNNAGQLGYPTMGGTMNMPQAVSSLVGITAVEGGEGHSLGLRRNGIGVLAWGNNQDGQLGDGTFTRSIPPVQVSNLSGVTKVVAGAIHSMALKSDRTIAAWGHNGSGQLADGTEFNRGTPVTVQTVSGGPLTDIVDFSAGIHSIALKENGSVWSWGRNDFNALGNSAIIGERIRQSRSLTAVPVDVLSSDVRNLAAGRNHSLARRADMTVWAWGRNAEGQLGTGTPSGSPTNVLQGQLTPVQANISGVSAIAAGGFHSLALVNGTVWTWGNNDRGQLGNGNRTNNATPTPINLSNIIAIAGGLHHSLALRIDGTVWAWGSNEFGQLGINTLGGDSTTPVQVIGLTGVKSIAAGENHNLVTVEARRISGRITRNGVGLPNVTVTLAGSPTTITQTKADGEYVFENLALHGAYTVTPSSANFTFTADSATTIGDFTGNRVINFTAQPASSSRAQAALMPGPLESLGNINLTLGTLSQTKPVFDKSIPANPQNQRIVIEPLANTNGKRFKGFVSTNAINFVNQGVSVRVEQTANATGETIFSVGTDKDNWVRFNVKGSSAAASVTDDGDVGVENADKQLIIEQKKGAPSSPPVMIGSLPYDPAKQQFLNISQSNGMIVFSTSANGTTWTAQTAVPSPPPAAGGNAAAIELGAGTSGATAQPGNAAFSALNVGAPANTNTLQFASDLQLSEGEPRVTLTVTRSGDKSGAATVEYVTIDDLSPVPCSPLETQQRGTAYARCDYATTVDTLQFAAGQESRTIDIPIVNDAHVEGNETFSIQLRTPGGNGVGLGEKRTAVVTILDNDTDPTGPNPAVSSIPFFVRQQYLDFLSREPEQSEPWSAILNNCANIFTPPQTPSECDRIHVSSAFFRSREFELKGLYVYFFYKAAFGDFRPDYNQIVTDLRAVTGTTTEELNQKRAAFAVAFVGRPEFDQLRALSPPAYVDALLRRFNVQQITTENPASPDDPAEVTLTRQQLIDQLASGALTRAQVLRAVVQSREVNAVEFNGAFVAMQYYGYLRRAPEEAGYQDNLGVLNNNPNDFRRLVHNFLNSDEYRLRFGRR